MLLAAVDFDNLHQVLRVLYDEMMPLCSNMTGVAKGIAGLGALFYVAANIKKHFEFIIKSYVLQPPQKQTFIQITCIYKIYISSRIVTYHLNAR